MFNMGYISPRVGDPSYEEYCFERDEASISLCEIHIPEEQDAETTCKFILPSTN